MEGWNHHANCKGSCWFIDPAWCSLWSTSSRKQHMEAAPLLWCCWVCDLSIADPRADPPGSRVVLIVVKWDNTWSCEFEPRVFMLLDEHISVWWFGTCFIFPYIGNNHPNWLIFFRGVETTNQYIIFHPNVWRNLLWSTCDLLRRRGLISLTFACLIYVADEPDCQSLAPSGDHLSGGQLWYIAYIYI